MKKLLFIILVILVASGTAFSQVTFGVGASGGTKAGIGSSLDDYKINLGAHARFLVDLSEDLGVIGGATYYLPSEAQLLGGTDKYNLFEFNADLVYYLVNTSDLQFYGLGGTVFTSLKTETSFGSFTATNFGWEAGAGVKIGRLFIEVKYDNRVQQMVGIVGFYF